MSNDGLTLKFNIDLFSSLPAVDGRSGINLEMLNGLEDANGNNLRPGNYFQNSSSDISISGYTPAIIPGGMIGHPSSIATLNNIDGQYQDQVLSEDDLENFSNYQIEIDLLPFLTIRMA